MLNKELESSLNGAFARARDKRHEFMTVEHLLLALLENDAAKEALLACKVTLMLCVTNSIFLSTKQRRSSQKAMRRAKPSRH